MVELASSLCASASLLALLLQTNAPVADVSRVRAVRTTTAIHVDGVLDDPAWQAAGVASGFRQREPREGEPATETTEVRVVYDHDTLYVGILARDREPEKVIGRVLERDKVMTQGLENAAKFAGDDVVAFTLDPFHDHRNAYLFATNPNGAELDALVTDESPNLNLDWRAVWRVAARRVPGGWSAEFAIPFRSLRYPELAGPQTWGLDVERIVRRKNEETLWSAWTRAEGGLSRVSRAGHLEGLEELPRTSFNAEARPFGLAGVTRTGGAPANGEWRLGADLKWEATPGLVVDGTVRPDFAQVEADDQIVNLTRFETFFPEKRDFFLENAGVFDFGTRGSYETPPFLMFFSRRIGIAGEAEVPVLGGARLSGRAGKQTIGLLDVYTEDAPGAPPTNFGVVRVKRDAGKRGYVGGMLTDRRTSSTAETDLGADASLWPTSRLNLQGFAARLTPNEGATDWAARGAAEYQADPVYLYGEYMRIGPGAQTGMGFVTETDVQRASGKAQYTFRPRGPALRSVTGYVGGKHQSHVNGEPRDANAFAGLSLGLHSGDGLTLTHVRGYIDLDWGFTLAGRVPVDRGRHDLVDTELSIYSSGNRALSGSYSASVQEIWHGHLAAHTVSLALKPASHLSLSATYTRSAADLPGGSFVAHVAGLRVGWSFSTRLAAHVYAQYNSLDRRFVGNFRLRLIHRPGSDLYLVFNEERGEPGNPRALLARGAAVKLSYLIPL